MDALTSTYICSFGLFYLRATEGSSRLTATRRLLQCSVGVILIPRIGSFPSFCTMLQTPQTRGSMEAPLLCRFVASGGALLVICLCATGGNRNQTAPSLVQNASERDSDLTHPRSPYFLSFSKVPYFYHSTTMCIGNRADSSAHYINAQLGAVSNLLLL